MIQLYRPCFSAHTVNRDQISDSLLYVKDHFTILTVATAIVIAGNLIESIPSTSLTYLVNGQYRIKITVFRGQPSCALLRGYECCPCGGSTGIACMIWLSWILGSAGRCVHCRTAKREFARLFLYLSELIY